MRLMRGALPGNPAALRAFARRAQTFLVPLLLGIVISTR
jgi:hypothetical protein